MTLLPADYVLLGLTGDLSVFGLFRGFSGALALVAATAAAAGFGGFAWGYSETLTTEIWMRGVGTLLAALLVFGIVRMIVRKIVNGLLSQPADSIFGILLGVACGAALCVIWAASGMYLEYSSLVQRVAAYL